MIRNPIQAKAEMNTSMNIGPPSAWVTTAAAHKPAVSTVVAALITRMCAGGRARARAGLRGGWAPASPAGMSAVTSASSAQVREMSVRATRASSSSLVSRPCTNPALSTSITCSRSAWDARRRLRSFPAAARLPVLTSPAPPRQYGAHKPSAAAFWRPFPQARRAARGPLPRGRQADPGALTPRQQPPRNGTAAWLTSRGWRACPQRAWPCALPGAGCPPAGRRPWRSLRSVPLAAGRIVLLLPTGADRLLHRSDRGPGTARLSDGLSIKPIGIVG